MLPRGYAPMVTLMAMPLREASSRAVTWLIVTSGGFLATPPERWAPVLPHGPAPVVDPLAPYPREADSHAATWLRAHNGFLNPTSPRGGLPCYHVA
jgi:hypothetical protein